MTIRPIRYLGDPILRKPAKKVRKVDDSIRRLVDDMIESMVAAQGVGLAAPQIGVGLRIVVLGMPEQEPLALINPTVARRSGERRLDAEGCLSVPGYRGAITRSRKVTVKALDLDGKLVRVKADDDLLAQALEHEVDHVNGVLYVDRLDSPDDLVKLDAQGWAQEPDGDAGEAGAGDSTGDDERPAGVTTAGPSTDGA
ncbi:MAG: peptide deformylase [Dehalococcoidia bacterium]|jgi:peptide deformylase|nr:peptide deformylase [Dehalococcoidia bacterium]